MYIGCEKHLESAMNLAPRRSADGRLVVHMYRAAASDIGGECVLFMHHVQSRDWILLAGYRGHWCENRAKFIC